MALSPAMAGSAAAPPSKSQTVSAKGLDLSRTMDAKIVFAQIEAVATQLCRDVVPRYTATTRFNRKVCEQNAIENAVRSVDTPAMYDLLDQRHRN